MDAGDPKARGSSHASGANGEADSFLEAMRMLSWDERTELIRFIDHALSTINDPKALARAFDNGNLYFSWKSDEGPRLALLAIRKAAYDVTDTPPKSPTPTAKKWKL